ncbi:hypothetical protein N656DRAFT_779998 [Canariomyces notabilis]|uniref:Luciferase domain-containing protein n=1 Tax=Canariomyces notabilis TaxID=2074819 RepID=A0AAN6YSC3_9PEZI|nr:hypothetical protein N656DRAFT_779998 [Canariomyces arenarius]
MAIAHGFADIWRRSTSLTSRTLTILALTIPIPLIFVPRLLASYRTYLSLGKGGVPHNFLGYLVQAALRPIARTDLRADPPPYHSSIATVAERYAPHGLTSFLPPSLLSSSSEAGKEEDISPSTGVAMLSIRRPPRPEVPYFVAPQRQTSQAAAGDVVSRMIWFLRALAEQNAELLEIRPSGLEGVGTDAIFLKATATATAPPRYMGMAKAEIVHVHPEGSSHVTLSLVDAEAAVRAGWAERHPLTGVRELLPWGYVFLYAPRDDAEYEVWKGLVVAGCSFVSGGKEIKGSDSSA